MLYKHYIGSPRPNMPESVKMLDRVSTHYQTGTEMVYVYADFPFSDSDSDSDLKEFEAMKARAEVINNRETPIWI